MSYILEALRKSQQDREIGRVPTLANQPLTASQDSGGNPWGLMAMVLAGLAVAIALYAALRNAPEGMSPTPAQPLAVTQAQATGPTPGAAPVSGTPPPALVATPAPSDPGQAPTHAAARLSTSASPPATPPAPPAPGTAAMPAGQPATPAGSPRVSARPAPPASLPAQLPASVDEDIANPETDEAGGESEVGAAGSTRRDGIPDDLRQDIQSFKEQLSGGEGSKTRKKAVAQKQVTPQERRLPHEVEQRLPTFLLTVHIYDAEPTKRFVIIDGRKLRQGESTRNGVLVEEILPDGVALAFEGHPFFRPR
jgi:general secretion pathway protein B